MVSTSCSNSRFINWNNSTIWVGYKSSIRSIASSITYWSSSSINTSINSIGSKVISTSSCNSRFINRHNSAIWVSNKLGVQVKRVSITNSCNWSSSNNRGTSSISNSLRCKVVSTSCSYSWFIKRNNSSVWVSNELCVQVKRSSISITSSISRSICSIACRRNNWGSSSIN